ncbi:FAD dependent oxidoreductase [Lindgomyces ingoldianus]|uniref:FAD dependent oxidoreductase n=1 Tax=Lindgomyces ingoldianus TaxID=673940 RepID=A0ACB6R5B8_9PLEO|nr:FAD dependent oxidoreductase [Lindgomyces ingoldianus]KAF2473727.1 FAD dependent oxidoreductase [Lindgomyces ingoldianus]
MEERGCIPVGLPAPNPLPSYWHIPKSPLANHIESELPSECDYVIIGSGISGTLIAYGLFCSEPGSRVVILEAREACGGATGRNGGHTKAASYRTYLQHREELGKEEALKIARLEYENILATHRLAREMKLDCESQECNTVDLIYDQETFERGKNAVEILRADADESESMEGGMAWYKVHSRNEAMARFWVDDKNRNPELEEDEPLAGAFEYAAGRINAYKFATGILETCVKGGLKLFTNTPVETITPAQLDRSTGSSCHTVSTPKGIILSRSVILATNGYTANLLPAFQGVIVPLRGQIAAQKPGSAPKFPTPLPTTYSFIYKYGYEYMIPRPLSEGGQHIIIGGGLGRQPEGGAGEFGTVNDSELNGSISRYLRGSLVGYFGKQNWGNETGERITQEWTGIMGTTADGIPFVGPMPKTTGLWIAAGFNGHGMVLCLKSAEALVHIIRGGSVKQLDWFPTSFLINQARLSESVFHGRTDMKVPETRGESIAQSKL